MTTALLFHSTRSSSSRHHRVSSSVRQQVLLLLQLLLILLLAEEPSCCCHAFCSLKIPISNAPIIGASRRTAAAAAAASSSSSVTAASQLQAAVGDINGSTSNNGNSSTVNKNRVYAAASSSSTSFYEMAVPGPPLETKPDYANIVGPLGRWTDSLFMTVFRHQLEYYSQQQQQSQHHQQEQPQPRPLFSLQDGGEYQAIIDLAATMNRQYSTNRTEIHVRAQCVLQSLFPSWMPSSYAVLFSKPFPAFSARMNAWATFVAGTWLMGECEINNVAIDGDDTNNEKNTDGDDTVVVVSGIGQGLLVKRCRFLEESGCASICVNSCKIPTQKYVLVLPIQQRAANMMMMCFLAFLVSRSRLSCAL
jgi:Beta-carotene isomerase D27-like, C-terminal